MNVTHTGIAVGVALVLVGVFFIFPGFWPFGTSYNASSVSSADTSSNSYPSMQNSASLKISDDSVGSGAVAKTGDTITVQYVGSLTDGTVFDASRNHGDQGFTFTLGAGQVIQGWDQGIVGMKVGGKRSLVIPPELAYGSRSIGDIIPANSTLIFEVELVKVGN